MKRTGQGLAETLVEMEFLSPEEIRAQSVRRMKAIIYSAFTWTSGKYRFEELENPVDEDVAMNMAPAGAIMEGIRRIQDPVIIRNILGDLKGVIRQPNAAPLPYDEENDFTPQEIVVMDLLAFAWMGLPRLPTLPPCPGSARTKPCSVFAASCR